ncbi:MAG TPA: hypothetical protein VIP51_11745 [Eoetvoesiella sp.]
MAKVPPKAQEHKQEDDRQREDQRSHGDQQNRTKKDGHTSQIGTGHDQISQHQRGEIRRPG